MPISRYKLQGALLELLKCRSREVLCEGPAGTGKSLCWLFKIHYLCEHVPGVRVLIVRKTRTSLTESALMMYERDVLPLGHYARRGPSRAMRKRYTYANGSEVIVGGMDNPDKILSTDFDVIYVQEGTELAIEDWETLSGRLRSDVLQYQQIGCDANPNAPGHWLNLRFPQASGSETKAESSIVFDGEEIVRTRILSRLTDNAAFFEEDSKEFTVRGRRYLAGLKATMTGHRYQRFVDGVWAAASGLVYDCFEQRPAWHSIDGAIPPADYPYSTCPRFRLPDAYTLSVGVDFGLNNTAVVIFAHERIPQVWGDAKETGRTFVVGVVHEGVRKDTKEIVEVLARRYALLGRKGALIEGEGGSHQESGWRGDWAQYGVTLREPRLSGPGEVPLQVARLWQAISRRRLIVFEDCESVLHEFNTFQYDDKAKDDDRFLDEVKFHRLAATRYASSRIFSDIQVGQKRIERERGSPV